jgi:methylenetetrahydrofolate--tRNA-(uracil-5-)-methyltransferase
MESASMGLLAGRLAAGKLRGENFALPPQSTMLGALLNYVTDGVQGKFSPMNANLGLLPTIEKKRGSSKGERKKKQCEFAEGDFLQYVKKSGLTFCSIQQ